ncbi:hypothetical protein ACN3E9_06760 [Vibrio pectenicida]|uniref:hypothetical protein n=1 Tax=Vibrio pectenicida TaxID=62763 RepID=UPI003B9AE9D6
MGYQFLIRDTPVLLFVTQDFLQWLDVALEHREPTNTSLVEANTLLYQYLAIGDHNEHLFVQNLPWLFSIKSGLRPLNTLDVRSLSLYSNYMVNNKTFIDIDVSL